MIARIDTAGRGAWQFLAYLQFERAREGVIPLLHHFVALVANRLVIVPRFHPCVSYLVHRATVRAGENSRCEARAAACAKLIPSGQYAGPTSLIPIECQRYSN